MENGIRYKPYPRYKDSGVEWFGEIPEEWATARMKFHVPVQAGYAFKSDEFHFDGVPVVRMANLKETRLELSDAMRIAPEDALDEFALKEGDILIGMSGSIGLTAIVAVSDLPCQLNQRVGRFRFLTSRILGEFLRYFVRSRIFTERIILNSTGTAQLNVSPEEIGNVWISIPRLEEQRAIAEFLDRETAKIDDLVAKKERLIELLEEKRAALITHAVTRGLNPDAPLRDSGIEWLGQVPAHWQVRKLKSLAQITYGIGGELDRLALTGTPIFSLPNVTIDGRLNLDDVAFTPLGEGEKKELLLKKGDLLFNWRNGSSDHVGKTALFSADGEYTHVSFLLRLRFRKSDCDSQYYHRYLNSLRSTGFFSSTKAGVNNTFNQTELQNLYVVKPPVEEQQVIANSIEGDIERVHTMVAAVLRAIERLKEYRSALITAAVTGKIDVRDEVKAAA